MNTKIAIIKILYIFITAALVSQHNKHQTPNCILPCHFHVMGIYIALHSFYPFKKSLFIIHPNILAKEPKTTISAHRLIIEIIGIGNRIPPLQHS